MNKKKTKEKLSPIDRIRKICPELSNDDIILNFAYNLHPTEPEKRCKGIVAVTKQELIIIRDEEVTKRIQIVDIESVNVENGDGSCAVA